MLCAGSRAGQWQAPDPAPDGSNYVRSCTYATPEGSSDYVSYGPGALGGQDHTPLSYDPKLGYMYFCETVSALGVNVQALRSLNFAAGVFLAGLSGVLAAGQLGLEPTMGPGLLMPSFVAIIVGGVGSLTGTLIGGLLIGVASGLTAVFLPAASEAVIYVLMALILLLRPRGLLGEEGMMT